MKARKLLAEREIVASLWTDPKNEKACGDNSQNSNLPPVFSESDRHAHHDFAAGMAFFLMIDGFLDPVERKDSVDVDFDYSAVDELGETEQMLPVGLAPLPYGSNPMLFSKVFIRLTLHRDQNTAFFENCERFVRDFTADQVEDGVKTCFDIHEFLAIVIDSFIGAQASDEFHIVTSYCGCHIGTQAFGQLDGQVADASGSSMDENFLTAREFHVLFQSLECANADKDGCGRLFIACGFGFRPRIRGLDQCRFGKRTGSAAEHEGGTVHIVVDLQIRHITAGLRYPPGKIRT